MMKKFFLFFLPLVLFAVSCSDSDDGGGNNGPVTLAPGTQKEQQVYADEQQGPAPIKFTAAAPWTATVVAVQTKADGGSEVDWLTLSAYSGGAGEVSLTMELKPNLTGKDRKAEIRISCGGVTITITVEQKGTTESGEKPEPGLANYALVESIEADFNIGCKEEGAGRSTGLYVFRYDDQNRIAEYEITEYGYSSDGGKQELSKYTTRFDYGIQGEIRLTEKEIDGSDYSGTKTYRVELDDDGRAARFKGDGSDGDGVDSTITFSYNDEGRLARIWYGDTDNGTSELEYEEITYQNGVLTKYFEYVSYDEYYEIVFPTDAFSDHPNDRLNIDPNWLLFADPVDPDRMLSVLRLTGKGCDRLTLWLPNSDDDDDTDDWDWVATYPEPNVTIHKTHDYYEHKTGRLEYTFNDDGTIATIVQPVTCNQMRYEYDIVSSNELYNPENPNYGYKATQKNRKTSVVSSTADQHKWTFTYRK